MNPFKAIILGLVQGITEFLPISSTAHLRIVPALLGWEDPGAAFSAVIQLGSVAAVIIYFWREVVRFAVAWLHSVRNRAPFESLDSRLAWFLIVGTIPVGVAGLLFKKSIETSLRSLHVIASSMIALAILLYIAERLARHRRTLDDMTMRDGVAIGLCQAVALIPGSSRSGTTLTGGLAVGLRREDAARYSFLLSIPANGLAGLFEFRHFLRATDRPSFVPLAVGTAMAFLSGLGAIAGLLRYFRTHSTIVFVVYRIALGTLLFALLATGVLAPFSQEAQSQAPSVEAGR